MCTMRQMLHTLVSFQVEFKPVLPCGIPGTDVALVRFLAGVDANVRNHVALPVEGLSA